MTKITKDLFMFICLTFFSLSSNARWVTTDEASIIQKFHNKIISINENGTSEEISEISAIILNETSRSNFASFNMKYSSDIGKLEILEAYTILSGKKYVVDLSNIEDKPLASSPYGFDQERQILLSFPNTEIGAEIYLKYKQQLNNPIVKGYYSEKIFFPSFMGCIQSSNIKITSKLPLYFETNDPNNSMEIKTYKNKLHISLKKPVCNELMSTSENGSINNLKYTWIIVSSSDNWNKYAIENFKGFKQVIDQPLPQLFSSIAKEAKKENDEVARINLITSLLNDKIRYMGNWVSIKGKFAPRDLNLVAKTQEGDCKDFAAVTAAILKSIGKYKIQFVQGIRDGGYPFLIRSQKFYSPDTINHVFLKITNDQGKTYWVDPTNYISMAQHIFPDIAGRPVTILDKKAPEYTFSPKIDNESNITHIENIIEIKGDNIYYTGNLSLKGIAATRLTGLKRFESEAEIRNELFFDLSGGNILNEEDKLELILPDLSSRVIKDLEIKYKFIQRNNFFKTNVGIGFHLDHYLNLKPIIEPFSNQIADIYIGSIKKRSKKTIIKDIQIENIDKLNYIKDSPWIYLKRKCSYNNGSTEILDEIIIKESFITSEELKTPQYLDLKTFLEKEVINSAVILSKL